MSSRCRSAAAGAGKLALLAVGACTRGAGGSERPVRSRSMPAADSTDRAAGVNPGIHPAVVLGELRNPYTGDRSAIANGQMLFNAMNCSGCHSGYAGGGMGPSLRDGTWIYGSSDAQIYSTIVEGRPNGMPAWGAKLPEEQIWKIIAYLRTLGTSNEPVKPPKPAYTVYQPPR
jgi:cytochrome c oxidase cbb3-type subunit 3